MMFANSLRYNTDRKSAVVKMTKRLKLWFKAGGLLLFLPLMLSFYIYKLWMCFTAQPFSLFFCPPFCLSVYLCVRVSISYFLLLRSLAYGKFTLVILFCFLESQSYCLHRIKICDSMKIRRKKILRQ